MAENLNLIQLIWQTSSVTPDFLFIKTFAFLIPLTSFFNLPNVLVTFEFSWEKLQYILSAKIFIFIDFFAVNVDENDVNQGICKEVFI